MAAKDIVEKAISENKIAIFSKSWCPYCKKAKTLLSQEYDAQTVVFELDEREDGGAIQNYLLERDGQRTVPNIFIGQKHIGGCDDVFTKHKKGEIAALLK
ncbi:hypothetical protein AGABI1DRAFT_82018 [Agaricus bisporus var. burnettii JB137-S8]|nr:uncharacterized protein AGABI1DRAFT_82018 [Agaricus bisporus var. burnettii JB137-S8]EKM84340.1 hypothetical protein AGABI1DRAFT_82018 [Agaricus bisporus var. burnettii JB137-S8]